MDKEYELMNNLHKESMLRKSQELQGQQKLDELKA